MRAVCLRSSQSSRRGTARGGILVAAAEKFGLPIHAIGVGETADDLRPFDPRAVARAIAGLPPE